VLELAVPGFNPTIPIDQPWWARDTDVFEFSWDHELYFRLLAKKHVFIDARTRTNMFLRASPLPNMRTSSPPSSHTLMSFGMRTTMDSYLLTSVFTVLQTCFTRMPRLGSGTSANLGFIVCTEVMGFGIGRRMTTHPFTFRA
jgi:hypothetical protein